MSNVNSILPPGYTWTKPPDIMVGKVYSFTPNGGINVRYPATGGWGHIRADDFAPGEFEQIGLGCQIERFCGEIEGPEGKKFVILARKDPQKNDIFIPRRPLMAKSPKHQKVYYVVWLRTGQCVTGFHYPPKVHNQNEVSTEGFYDPTTGEIYPSGKPLPPGKDELAISEGCYAVLGNDYPYKFDTRDNAQYIASIIPEAKVEPWED